MKKSGIFLLAAVLSLPVWAGKLDDDCRKVRAWINENPNQVSRRLHIRVLNKIMNFAQSEAQKIEALQKKFPYAFGVAWQKDLDAAKAQGIEFSVDNKILVKCPKSVTSVIIPSCVTTIGKEAFAWRENLTSVTTPASVTSIGDAAFYGCSNLTSVTIPASVTTIGDYAFSRCFNLTITIPASVTTIGDRAFLGVQSVKVADDNPAFMVDDAGALIDIENQKLLYFPQSYRGSYVIPDGITTIGDAAFSDCKNLTSVTIGNSVTTIGNEAFGKCSNLTSVTIGNSVTTIGNSAFPSCYELTSVTIPANAKYTESGVFKSFPANCKVIRRK